MRKTDDHPARQRHGRDAETARRSLEDLARGWGQEIVPAPAQAAAPAGPGHGPGDDGKVIDPVAVASLVLSLPSAALAVADLADRIRKRRRAADLIDHARQLAARQVTIYLISYGRPADLHALTPDQLLDQIAGEDPAS